MSLRAKYHDYFGRIAKRGDLLFSGGNFYFFIGVGPYKGSNSDNPILLDINLYDIVNLNNSSKLQKEIEEYRKVVRSLKLQQENIAKTGTADYNLPEIESRFNPDHIISFTNYNVLYRDFLILNDYSFLPRNAIMFLNMVKEEFFFENKQLELS